MRSLRVFYKGQLAGRLIQEGKKYIFEYEPGYHQEPISLTLPVGFKRFEFDIFPPFFDGLLPEGYQLEALLRQAKLDRQDYMGQLAFSGKDPCGAVSCEE